ncbi:hypothetical protein AB0K00_25425 [Dactylosporangium sp. NPDC049525]|uniref:hypothetical protein n=1 Tax=Dactylosporangium sp. NPDC049525 TaxID=3154730 RepID=UPI00343A5C94
MTTPQWDDAHLVTRLAEAVQESYAVPQSVIESGRAMFAWRNIDADLAALEYDSLTDSAARSRADMAALRSLTYSTEYASIELTFMSGVVFGQILPQCPAQIDVRTASGIDTRVTADHLGVFTIEPPPAGPFFLHCQHGTSINVRTPLITP